MRAALATAVGASLLFAAGAQADVRIGTFGDSRFGMGMAVLGTPGADEIEVSGQSETLRVTDPSGVAAESADCVQEAPTAVVCELGFGVAITGRLGAGDDELRLELGRAYDTRISGEDGDDTLRGSPWRDELRGDAGNDTLIGGEQQDELSGGSGNDRIAGGADGDRGRGGSGRDRLRGMGGGDRLYGQAGSDFLLGGGDADTLFADDGRRDRAIRCGSGPDFAFVDRSELKRHPGCETWATRTGAGG